MLQNYFKIAFRNLLKNKVYSSINVLGLAIGLSACLVIYSLVTFELSYDDFHPEKEKIYRIVSEFKKEDGSINYNPGLSSPMPKAIRQEVTGLEKLAAFQVFWTKVSINKGKINEKKFAEPVNSEPDIIVCEPEYFQIFKYQWLAGNPANNLKAKNEVVLTESKAKLYFGDIPLQNFIGQLVTYGDSLSATVTGIVKNLPNNTNFIFNDFISFKSIENKSSWASNFQLNAWTNTNGGSQAFIKLANETKPKGIEKQMATFMTKHLSKEDVYGRVLKLQAISDIHFSKTISTGFGRGADLNMLYILLGVAMFLILIAAINFINLATAQSINRVKEIGIRKVMGSSRKSLIIQFLCETFVITLLAVIIAVFSAQPLIWAYSDFIPKELYFNVFQPSILFFLIIILILTSLLSGLYPAFVISAYNPAASLKNIVKNGTSRTSAIRKGLITFQFAFSQVFILGTILVATQSKYMLKKDLGIKKDAVLVVDIDWNQPNAKRKVLTQKLKQIPEIEIISISDVAVRGGYSTTQLKYNNGKTELIFDPHRKEVDTNFIAMFGLKLLAGKNISSSDTTKEYLVNEAFVKAIGIKSPKQAIGKMIDYYDTKGNPMKIPIVGVLADFHFQSLHNTIKPLFVTASEHGQKINLKLTSQINSTEKISQVLKKIKAEYFKVYPESQEAYNVTFLNESVAKLYEKEKQMANILNSTTMIAILISCMGLFGLVAFATTQRTKEIGIRKVLGASVNQIIQLISKDFLKLIGFGILIASPIAYFCMQKWLQKFAYKVDISWWIFALAAISSITIALLTISYQALKAALANPVKSLRSE